MNTLKFEELNLSKELQRAIADMGFEETTPIQTEAIPAILSGKDIIGQAQTGTGKTASFGIPVIERIDSHSKKIQSLVLCPTRELAIQVSEELTELLKYRKGARVIPVYGGQPIDRQIKALKSGVQIIIGTPGRIIDHLDRGSMKLDDLKFLVLDEADEMLDMGFRDDIELILRSVPKDRQTIMFSATMPKPILDLSKKYLRNAEHIKVVHKELTAPNVNQFFIELRSGMKLDVLTRLLDIYNPKLSLVFCNTKRRVDDLISHLQARGYFAEGLHGDMKQNMRDRVMSKFRRGDLELLAATDVAARGIDVEEIDLVINYDMPQDEEYYVHRIGRTARAGRAGKAITFITGNEFRSLREIERFTHTNITPLKIPTLKDIEEVRTNAVLEDIKKTISEEKDLHRYSQIVEKLMNENYALIEIAASLMKMTLSVDEKAEEIDENFKQRQEKPERFDKGSKKKGKERNSDTVRLYINIGKKQNVKPNDIVGAIAGESGIPGKSIGAIEIFDKFSFVEVPRNHSARVIKSMDGNTVKGREVTVRIANDRP